MTSTDLIDRLAQHSLLGTAPREELAWLASHGSLRQLNAGDVVSSKDEPVEGMSVVLKGRIAIFVEHGGGLRKLMEWREGEVTGLLPYSRLGRPPGNNVAIEPTEVLLVHRDDIPAMIRACYTVTSILVHVMLDRSRVFTSTDLQDEKMVSLGKLSAGLAHELNNPASAIERGAALLEQRLKDSESAARTLGASRLSDPQLAALDAVRDACAAKQVHGVRSPIEQAEREEEIADWLADHGLDIAIAETLAETSVTIEALDTLAGQVDGAALNAVLRSAAAGCSVRGLASEIHDAAARITSLVAAIKGFTHMDQAPVAESVDVPQGLNNTVTVLRSKARDKSVAVAINVEPNLPRVCGFAGELNQVWANLIDNALDAVPNGGRVEVFASRQGPNVTVRVIDNGGGIPEQIRERIFEPFFTTKPVGLGTGLGLDIVRRLILHNDGQITVESQPGRTEFRVTLPLAQRDAAPQQP